MLQVVTNHTKELLSLEQVGEKFGFKYIDGVVLPDDRFAEFTDFKFDPNFFELKFFNTSLGYGVFAKKRITKGQKLGGYAGIACDFDNSHNLCYGIRPIGKMSQYMMIDAEKYGNLSRFFQHLPTSEELIEYQHFFRFRKPATVALANLALSSVPFQMNIPLIYFYASEDIEIGEQMGFSYGSTYWKGYDQFPSLFDKTGNVLEKDNYDNPTLALRIVVQSDRYKGRILSMEMPYDHIEHEYENGKKYMIFKGGDGALVFVETKELLANASSRGFFVNAKGFLLSTLQKRSEEENALGTQDFKQQDYHKALTHFFSAIKELDFINVDKYCDLKTKKDIISKLKIISYNIGSCYQRLHKSREAMERLQQSAEYTRALSMPISDKLSNKISNIYATRIQSVWRGHKVRASFKKK